jgi:tripartite ATP-independent transporter DctP family solute receptor
MGFGNGMCIPINILQFKEWIMKRIILALFCFIPVVLYAGAGNETQGSGKKMTIRYADVQAENDTETLAARKFAELVGQKTNGRIEIKVFPNGQLGDMKDIIQSVQMGAIEICRNNPSWLADAGAKQLNIFSLPFVFDNLEHANRVIDGKIGTDLLNDIQKNGLKMIGLGYLEPSLRYFFFKNKEVTSLKDIRGLKLRVPTNEMNTAMVEAFGASATPIAYNELYSSLQTGLVDGAENPLKGFINMKFGEVCKYFTFTGHQYEPSIVLVSEKFWDGLGKEDQQILKDAMTETSRYYKDISKEMYDGYIQEGEKSGVKFSNVVSIKEWQDAVKPLYSKFGAGFEDIIAEINHMK